MLRFILLPLFLFSLMNTPSWSADAPPVFTQKDFSRMIVEQFEWSKGLSKEKTDREYLMILGGKRTFRYEAENSYNPVTDRVTVRAFPMFGDFSGKGWLMGVSDDTSVTFTVLLPISGEYDLKAMIKGDGFLWNIDNKEYRCDSRTQNFQETAVTRVKLNAGTVVIKLTIPPGGAIDSFAFAATDHVPIQPLSGWRFREPLTAARMAEVAVSMTNSFSQLPDAEKDVSPGPIAVAEITALTETTTATTISYLGSFSSPKWIRSDFRGANLRIPLTISETGYYALTFNVIGESLSGKVNETPFKLTGKPYFEKLNAGLYRLESGDNTLLLTLPPMGGIDTIEFKKKRATPEDFLRLAGVAGPPDRQVGPLEAATLIKALQGSFTSRK